MHIVHDECYYHKTMDYLNPASGEQRRRRPAL